MGVRGNGVRVPASVLERARVPFGEPTRSRESGGLGRDVAEGSLGSAMQRNFAVADGFDRASFDPKARVWIFQR